MLGLPKGSMEEATVELFARAGWKIGSGSRSYKLVVNDADLDGRFVRSQEMSRYVEQGFFDAGLCGKDWILENGSDVHEVCELIYSRASNRPSRYVLAVPEDSPIRSVEDLAGKRVATEVVNITRRYLEEKGISAEVEFSWGATEVKVPDLVDAIVDITETGGSLRANRLRIVDTLMTTTMRFIANKLSWDDDAKRRKIENIALLLQAALQAHDRVGLKLNCPKRKVDQLLDDLPALRNPTISRLADDSWVALDTILEERVVREIIPVLKAHGAEGIIEYPLNKVVY